MRWLAYLAVVLLAIAGAIFGPHALSARTPLPQPAGPSGLVWRNGTFSMRLTDQPCEREDLRAELEEEGIPPAKVYIATQGSIHSIGCWVLDMSGDVMTRNARGEEGTVPMGWFRREPAT